MSISHHNHVCGILSANLIYLRQLTVGLAITCMCVHQTHIWTPQARVQSLGGEIMYWNGDRVMGVLAVSRAIGDHNLRPFVIAQPEVSATAVSVPPLALCAGRRSALQTCLWLRSVGNGLDHERSTTLSECAPSPMKCAVPTLVLKCFAPCR